MAVSVSFDPTTPLGSEALKTGPSRIKATPANLLGLFGLSETVRGTFISPIKEIVNPNGLSELVLANDPTTPMSAASMSYADRRTFAVVASGDGTNPYLLTPGIPGADLTPGTAANAISLVHNSGATNTGLVFLGTIELLGADGSHLGAGEFVTNTVYMVIWDGAHFRKVDFEGGTLTQPLILAADPTANTGAATRQFVLAEIDPPHRTLMPNASVALSLAPADIIVAPTFMVPDDNIPRAVHVEYAVSVSEGAPHISRQTTLWVTDGTDFWAASNWATASAGALMAGSGFSPTKYAPGATVTLKVQGISTDKGFIAAQSSPNALRPSGFPISYMTVTVMRTHS